MTNDIYGSLQTTHLDAASEPQSWIWEGLIGPGQITLFTSVPKIGKTTLLGHLLASRNGGGDLIGRPVTAGVTAIVSEESPARWRQRNVLLGFGDTNRFFCRPFKTIPSPQEWRDFIEHLLSLHKSEGIDLVIVDPLSHFLPRGGENEASLLLESLLPLRRLTETGLALVLVHHPRKAPAQAGLTARGSTMLTSFMEILMEMYPVNADDPADRRRRLLNFSRDPATPRVLLFESNTEGRALTAIDELPEPDEFQANWEILRMVFEDATEPLTRQAILEQWPTTFLAPKAPTLWKWLNRAQERGLVRREGTGRRADSFRYFLPDRMEAWKQDPLFGFNRMIEENTAKVKSQFGGKC